MQRALKRVLPISIVACLGSVVPLWAQSEPALPEAQAKPSSRICGGHGIDMVINMRMSEGGWAGVIDDMVSRGAEANSDEIALVTKYLAANFGPDNAAGTPKVAKVHVNTAGVKELVFVWESPTGKLPLLFAIAKPTEVSRICRPSAKYRASI